MTSGAHVDDITAPPYHTGASSLWVDDVTTPSTERSLADEFMEEASKYLADLARLNSVFFGTMTEGTTQSLSTPNAPYFLDIPNPIQACSDTKHLNNTTKKATFTVYEDVRRQYKCTECGKRHDRRVRAEDCRNVDLGIKPYRCRGECGKASCKQGYASEALLRRHCGPHYLRVVECSQCHLQLYKQNLARHLRTCKGSPSQRGL